MNTVPDWRYKIITPQGIKDGDLIWFSTREVFVEAEKYGITWEEIPGTRIFKLTYGDLVRHFYAQVPSFLPQLSFHACEDKNITRALLQQAGLQVTKGFCIYPEHTQDYQEELFQILEKPLVVKPTHGNQGTSVFMNITTLPEYFRAVETCLKFSQLQFSGAIVEETAQGEEYRVLATKEKVIGVINRIPANVIGDGASSINDLIIKKNSDPRRKDDHSEPILKIPIDETVIKHLANQKLDLDSVPEKDKRIFLRSNSNISTGGDSIDVTDQVHPSVIERSLQVMQAIPGLEFAGIDFMTKDITVEQTPDMYRIIEVNGSPGFSIHDFPYEGKSRNAAQEFLCLIFPELKNV